jgi:hypothetical protein
MMVRLDEAAGHLRDAMADDRCAGDLRSSVQGALASIEKARAIVGAVLAELGAKADDESWSDGE